MLLHSHFWFKNSFKNFTQNMELNAIIIAEYQKVC